MGTLNNVQKWPSGATLEIQDTGISIQVTPPEDEEDDEDDFVPQTATKRHRRKLSTPLCVPPRPPSKSLSALDTTKRRFSTMVSSAAAAAVSRRLSATIGWCLATPAHVTPQIIRQGRALCMQYIRQQIKRSSVSCKKVILQRLKTTIETECDVEATGLHESGALAALTALCGALERARPELFRQVARQATRAPLAILRSDTALADLTLAVSREICKENITWCKIAAVYCVCGALAREAGEASEEQEANIEVVSAPAAALSDLLQDEVGVWIATHGGWNGLMAHCRASDRDRRSERNLHIIIALIVVACVSITLLRWLFPSPYHYE